MTRFQWTALSLVALAALGLALLPRPSAAAEPFAVIVNAANSTASLPAAEVSRMFLKKSTRWAGGERVLPVDLQESSAVREAFSHQIHGKGTAAIKAYWEKMIFSGRDVPPPEKASSGDAIAYVRANAGGIGYVAESAAHADGIKVLRVAP